MSRKGLVVGGAVGAAILVAALAGTRSFSPTVNLPNGARRNRDLVVLTAAMELGESDPSKYWRDAYGAIPASKYAWCGVFALWVLRKALGISWRWIAGIGFIYADSNGKRSSVPRLPVVRVPEPGDIAYYDQPFQHYAIVESVSGDDVSVIAGNTPNVSRSNEPLSKATAYYSIAALV